MTIKKGILLAGGYGTRLHPTTLAVNKHLLNIYSKPMIYYSLSTLMLADIREILIITLPEDLQLYKNLFSDGKYLGMKISYEIQKEPKGIAESIIIAENFIGKDDFALLLGDNFFYSENFTNILKSSINKVKGAFIFAYYVNNPQDCFDRLLNQWPRDRVIAPPILGIVDKKNISPDDPTGISA